MIMEMKYISLQVRPNTKIRPAEYGGPKFTTSEWGEKDRKYLHVTVPEYAFVHIYIYRWIVKQ